MTHQEMYNFIKSLLAVITIPFLFACNYEKTDRKIEINKKDSLNTSNLAFNNGLQSIFIKDLHPVFEFSSKTTAFTIEISSDETKTKLDTIFTNLFSNDEIYNFEKVPKGFTLYDTLGIYRLIKSEEFQKKVKPFFDKEFYIYGTLGFVKLKFDDIVIGIDECKTNFFAFCFDKSKLANIGNPIFCSSNDIKLAYLKNPTLLEARFKKYFPKHPYEYSDSLNTRFLGHVGNYYFTYNDDFIWGHSLESKCQFPSRSVYFITSKSIVQKWYEGLDLFGIPCD
jgi:hypothetical protein